MVPDRREPEDLGSLAEAAVAAAHRGGEVLKRRFREGLRLRVDRKGLHDFVTDVDRDAEAAIVEYLRGRFAAHSILAEEGSNVALDSDFRWIVDPLDGTTNFIHGVPVFAVSVAVEDPRGLAAGAVYDPTRDETFHAARGRGARLDEQPIRCGAAGRLEDALIATGFPFREMGRLEGYLAAFEEFVRGCQGLRRAGSAALDLAYTACGRYDGFWEIGLSPWDLAAGALLVEEAGGIVSDVKGGNRYLESGDIVAAAPEIHDAMVRITSRHLV